MTRMLMGVLTLILTTGMAALADTILVEAERDATLIEDPDGARANGSGPAFFAGRNSQAQNSIRRGLIRFDLAGLLPPGAIVEEAWLELHALPGNPPSREVRLHRVLAFWEEGPSVSSGGGGAPRSPAMSPGFTRCTTASSGRYQAGSMSITRAHPRRSAIPETMYGAAPAGSPVTWLSGLMRRARTMAGS